MGVLKNILNYSLSREVREYRNYKKDINDVIEAEIKQQENEEINKALLVLDKIKAKDFDIESFEKYDCIAIYDMPFYVRKIVLESVIKTILGIEYGVSDIIMNSFENSFTYYIHRNKSTNTIHDIIDTKIKKQNHEESKIAFDIITSIKNKLLKNEFKVKSRENYDTIVIIIDRPSNITSKRILNDKIKELLGNEYTITDTTVEYGTLNYIFYIERTRNKL